MLHTSDLGFHKLYHFYNYLGFCNVKALKNFALEKLIKNKIQEATSKQQLVFAPQNP